MFSRQLLLSTWLCASVLALAACKPAPQADTAADSAALEKAAAAWEKAFNDKDATAVAALYTEDAELLPPNAASVKGRAAAQEYWAHDINSAWAKLTITATSSGMGGDWAWRTGTWSAELTPPVTGKFTEVWRRTANGWQLHRDIWNADAPPATPGAAPAADAAMTPAQ